MGLMTPLHRPIVEHKPSTKTITFTREGRPLLYTFAAKHSGTPLAIRRKKGKMISHKTQIDRAFYGSGELQPLRTTPSLGDMMICPYDAAVPGFLYHGTTDGGQVRGRPAQSFLHLQSCKAYAICLYLTPSERSRVQLVDVQCHKATTRRQRRQLPSVATRCTVAELLAYVPDYEADPGLLYAVPERPVAAPLQAPRPTTAPVLTKRRAPPSPQFELRLFQEGSGSSSESFTPAKRVKRTPQPEPQLEQKEPCEPAVGPAVSPHPSPSFPKLAFDWSALDQAQPSPQPSPSFPQLTYDWSTLPSETVATRLPTATEFLTVPCLGDSEGEEEDDFFAKKPLPEGFLPMLPKSDECFPAPLPDFPTFSPTFGAEWLF